MTVLFRRVSDRFIDGLRAIPNTEYIVLVLFKNHLITLINTYGNKRFINIFKIWCNSPKIFNSGAMNKTILFYIFLPNDFLFLILLYDFSFIQCKIIFSHLFLTQSKHLFHLFWVLQILIIVFP